MKLKLTLFILTVFCAFNTHAQKSDSLNPLPFRWLKKGNTHLSLDFSVGLAIHTSLPIQMLSFQVQPRIGWFLLDRVEVGAEIFRGDQHNFADGRHLSLTFAGGYGRYYLPFRKSQTRISLFGEGGYFYGNYLRPEVQYRAMSVSSIGFGFICPFLSRTTGDRLLAGMYYRKHFFITGTPPDIPFIWDAKLFLTYRF
jgi:hypothetical protein